MDCPRLGLDAGADQPERPVLRIPPGARTRSPVGRPRARRARSLTSAIWSVGSCRPRREPLRRLRVGERIRGLPGSGRVSAGLQIELRDEQHRRRADHEDCDSSCQDATSDRHRSRRDRPASARQRALQVRRSRRRSAPTSSRFPRRRETRTRWRAARHAKSARQRPSRNSGSLRRRREAPATPDQQEPDDAELAERFHVQGVRVLDEQVELAVLRPVLLESACADAADWRAPHASTATDQFCQRPVPLPSRRWELTKSPWVYEPGVGSALKASKRPHRVRGDGTCDEEANGHDSGGDAHRAADRDVFRGARERRARRGRPSRCRSGGSGPLRRCPGRRGRGAERAVHECRARMQDDAPQQPPPAPLPRRRRRPATAPWRAREMPPPPIAAAATPPRLEQR